MIGTRHEEYRHFKEGIPFLFKPCIERTPFNCSAENNWHENLEIQLCLAGSGTVLLDGKTYPFHPQDIIVVNSNVLHYTGTETALTYSCLILGTEFCRNVGIDPLHFRFTPAVQSPALQSLFRRLTETYTEPTLPLRTAKLNALLLQILIELAERHAAAQEPPAAEDKYFTTVKDTLLYLRENYHRKITLDEIAAAVLFDKYALCRTFKKLTGQTIIENLNNYRCIKAMELLREGSSVVTAAERCGFSNLSFFTKTFKKYVGKLPSEYKK